MQSLHNCTIPKSFRLLACKIAMPIFEDLMPVMIVFSGHSGPDKRIVKYKASLDYIM